MNLIKRIKVDNIKGKSSFAINFTDLTANQPNIIVAPNGYGKSTIATAFKSAMHGQMKLDIRDIYQQNENNHPCLEIELLGEEAGTYIATDTYNNISKKLFLWVINSPLYAKSTSRNFGHGTTSSADLRVEDIMICKSIPKQKSIYYSYSSLKASFGDKGKLFLNIGGMLSCFENINRMCEIKAQLKKCIEQERIKNSFSQFIDDCPTRGTVSEIKKGISLDSITELRTNSNVSALFDCIAEMTKKPDNWEEIDLVFTAIQICKIMEAHYAKDERNILEEVKDYLDYKALKESVDERLADFNTTGRSIKTHEDHGKLVVRFDRADSMSNGERDILSFVANITIAEYRFRKKIGILVVDEIFDYLDGSNILAVQYYLSELIKRCKNNGKILYPLVFTHLDPDVFSNYYFNKKKIHYISFSSTIEMDSPIVKMLRLREDKTISKYEKDEIEKYYIHYYKDKYSMSNKMAIKIGDTFSDSNELFRQRLYGEITNKYLRDQSYNSVMVIAGVRIRIEELVFQQLSEDDKDGFINEHKVINKLNYALQRGVDVPELYYLLQPLYNDGLHLGGSDEVVQNKIKSSYLKTYNMHIKKMIGRLFEQH